MMIPVKPSASHSDAQLSPQTSPSPIVSGATRTPSEAPELFKKLATQISGENRITSWGIASFQVN